jgi:2-phosphosulfolactate phosphatase
MHVHVAFTPGEQTPAQVGIVVDVLRATSTICQALASGYGRVLCCAEVDEARALAETEGPAKLAGERRLEHIEGFDFGNSPRELDGEPAAETLILTTTNGTRLLVAAAERFERVYVGSLLNVDAVAAAARESGDDVAVLCAGVLGELALDDAYCAGRIAEPRSCSPAASPAQSRGSARAAAQRTSASTASRPTSNGAHGKTTSTSSRATSAASAPRPRSDSERRCASLAGDKELHRRESVVSRRLRAVCSWMLWTTGFSRALARGRGRRERGPACG